MPKFWRLPVILLVFLATSTGSLLIEPLRWPLLIAAVCVAVWALIARRRGLVLAVALAVACACGRVVWAEHVVAVVRRSDGRLFDLSGVIYRHEAVNDQTQRLYVGDVTIDLPKYPVYEERAVVAATCIQRPPSSREEVPALRNKYAKGLLAACETHEVGVIEVAAPCYKHPLICLHAYIVRRVENLWPRPVRSLVLGLLLGDKGDFQQEILKQFSAAGISHIIALSGFNITVIVVSLEAAALRLSVRKRYRPYVIIGLIVLFTVFVGAAASIVRAACMGALALWGKSLGRQPSARRLLLISAAAMTLANPYTLLYDIGFQLSCGATFGLLAFSEWFEERLWFIPESAGLRGSLSTTLAASLPTLPLLAWQFGSLSIIAPVTNMLVLPLIPHIMSASALAVLISLIADQPAQLLAAMVTRACRYILDVSAWAASFPYAKISTQTSTTVCIAASLAILLFSFYVERQKNHT